MFDIKELTQMLFALDTRTRRLQERKDEDLQLIEHGHEVGSLAYWNTCLQTLASARFKIEVELAIRDRDALDRVNSHFRKRRAVALAKKAEAERLKAAKKSIPPKSKLSPELPEDVI